MPIHDLRLPAEADDYRAARDRLLEAEVELRNQVEKVAELRRQLPLGGTVNEYTFTEGGDDLADTSTTRTVKLSELFGDHSTLVLYSFMYGPDMERACPLCTAFLDSLNGNAAHIAQQVALGVVAKSPVERLREFGRSRDWRHLRLLSSAGTSYQPDYLGEGPDGAQWPMMNVFVRRDGEVRHFWASEMLLAPRADGIDARHIDMMWPLWNVFDITPDGRPDWYPALEY